MRCCHFNKWVILVHLTTWQVADVFFFLVWLVKTSTMYNSELPLEKGDRCCLSVLFFFLTILSPSLWHQLLCLWHNCVCSQSRNPIPGYPWPSPALQFCSTLQVFDRRILYNYFVAPTEGRRVSGLLATVSCHHAQRGKIGPMRRMEVKVKSPFSSSVSSLNRQPGCFVCLHHTLNMLNCWLLHHLTQLTCSWAQ